MKYPSTIVFYKIARLYVISGNHSCGSGSSNNAGCIGSHRSKSNSNTSTSTSTSSRNCYSSSSNGSGSGDNPSVPYVQIAQRINSIFSVP